MRESEAIALYMQSTVDVIKRDWDGIRQRVIDITKDQHFIVRERDAIDALMTALVSLGMRSIRNLWEDSERAERLLTGIRLSLDPEFRREVARYTAVYEEAACSTLGGDPVDPVDAVVWSMLLVWTGNDPRKLTDLDFEKKLLLWTHTTELFLGHRYWKTISETRHLVSG